MKSHNHLRELKIVLIVIALGVFFGFVGPYLVSSKDTSLVVAGVVVALFVVYFTARNIYLGLTEDKDDGQN